MRGAGCTINDIADREFDAKVARTATRPLPSGAVTLRQALVFLALQLAIGLAIDPLLLLVPAAIGASCAFMMPVATPPNAIVFASGHVTIRQMASAGFWLNFVSIALVTLAAYTVVIWFLDADLSSLPAWATPVTE